MSLDSRVLEIVNKKIQGLLDLGEDSVPERLRLLTQDDLDRLSDPMVDGIAELVGAAFLIPMIYDEPEPDKIEIEFEESPQVTAFLRARDTLNNAGMEGDLVAQHASNMAGVIERLLLDSLPDKGEVIWRPMREQDHLTVIVDGESEDWTRDEFYPSVCSSGASSYEESYVEFCNNFMMAFNQLPDGFEVIKAFFIDLDVEAMDKGQFKITLGAIS